MSPLLLNSSGSWSDYSIARTYDLAGNVKTQTYPASPRSVTYNYDNAGRLSSFSGSLGDSLTRSYADSLTYNPQGQLLRERYPMAAATLWHNRHFNARGQLVDFRVGDTFDGNGTEWTWNRGAISFAYSTNAVNQWSLFANGPDNNGNLLRQVNYAPVTGGSYVHPQLDDYTYDQLNRVASVTEAQMNLGYQWTYNLFTQNFSYDRWGNRKVSCSPCATGVTNDNFTIDAATNRLTQKNGLTLSYDAAGHQTNDSTGNRWYDGEGRLYKATQGAQTHHYVYDADGNRVRRILNGVETWQIYGFSGELVAEYAANAAASSPQKEYGYRNGQALIVAQSSPLEIRWQVGDGLGSTRWSIRGTGADGGSLASVTRHDYLPFGEELSAGVGIRSTANGYGTDGVRQKFTTKERDVETGLDYFLARYYAAGQGRFTSPDEFTGGPDELYDFAGAASDNPTFYAMLDDPQSLNKYQYTYNNPLSMTDPDGHCPSCRITAAMEARQTLATLKSDGYVTEAAKAIVKEAANTLFIAPNNAGVPTARNFGWNAQVIPSGPN